MIEQIAMFIGYSVLGLAGVALVIGLLIAAGTWYEWNVLMPRLKFDGKGNIVKI